MRKLWWFPLLVVLALMTSLMFSVAAGPPDGVDPDNPKSVRDRDVGNGLKLSVFVKPYPTHDDPAVNKCDDGSQTTTVPKFAKANPNGLIFNINRGSIPIDKDSATQAIKDGFAAWDSIDTTKTYFRVNDTGGASRPAADNNNTVGFRKMSASALAAAWVWTSGGTVTQVDIFFNSLYKWGVYTLCNEQNTFHVGGIHTHESGHAVGLDHLADEHHHATLYPSGASGEVKKLTLTDGDKAGYTAAGGY